MSTKKTNAYYGATIEQLENTYDTVFNEHTKLVVGGYQALPIPLKTMLEEISEELERRKIRRT